MQVPPDTLVTTLAELTSPPWELVGTTRSYSKVYYNSLYMVSYRVQSYTHDIFTQVYMKLHTDYIRFYESKLPTLASS